jgi:hypothetical protein
MLQKATSFGWNYTSTAQELSVRFHRTAAATTPNSRVLTANESHLCVPFGGSSVCTARPVREYSEYAFRVLRLAVSTVSALFVFSGSP